MRPEKNFELPFEMKKVDLTYEELQEIIEKENKKTTEALTLEFQKILREDKEREKREQKEIEDKNKHAIATPIPSADHPETSSKIAKMIEEIKRRRAAQPPLIQIPGSGDPEEGHTVPIEAKNIAFCPTCGDNGHKHTMSLMDDGYTYKCTGHDCQSEQILVDKKSDYRCKDCGMPIKKPMDTKRAETDSCHWCGGKKAEIFDWNSKFQKLKAKIK